MRQGLCIALLLALLALAGCSGKGGSSTSSNGAGDPAPSTSSGQGSIARPSAEQARVWRRSGRAACKGMKPLEAALNFKAAAERAGAHGRFVELVTEPTAAVEQSPGYPELVAAFYATTLPAPQRTPAAAGCAEELAARE